MPLRRSSARERSCSDDHANCYDTCLHRRWQRNQICGNCLTNQRHSGPEQRSQQRRERGTDAPPRALRGAKASSGPPSTMRAATPLRCC
jgi:hypothetical protein